MYWNLIWKSLGFVPFGLNLTHFGAKSETCQSRPRRSFNVFLHTEMKMQIEILQINFFLWNVNLTTTRIGRFCPPYCEFCIRRELHLRKMIYFYYNQIFLSNQLSNVLLDGHNQFKVRQIGPKLDKSWAFEDQFSEHFGAGAKMLWKLIFNKSPKFVLIRSP